MERSTEFWKIINLYTQSDVANEIESYHNWGCAYT